MKGCSPKASTEDWRIKKVSTAAADQADHDWERTRQLERLFVLRATHDEKLHVNVHVKKRGLST